MNLVLARVCSNSCPYCFEAAERKGGKSNFISIENVTRLAAWARDTDLLFLSLMGGEPFLHPELDTIIKVFRNSAPKTGLRILTGGIFKQRLLDSISPEDTGIVFNVNEPRNYQNPKHFTKVINNVEKAISAGFKVTLGFNVWQSDFDTKFMPFLAHRMGQSVFRWTVANPQWKLPSSVIRPTEYESLSGRVIAMLQEAASYNIEALLDCPVPLCFFNDTELAWVRQYHPGTAAGLGVCYPVIDVTPELEAIRCFALSGLARVKVTDFSNEYEIQDWFLKFVDPELLSQGCFSDCGQCLHFKSGRCFGGCLAWHEVELDLSNHPGASKLALNMKQALEIGDLGLALQLYEGAGYWSKTDLPTYMAAFAALKLGERQRALRYAQISQDLTSDPELKQRIKGLRTEILSAESAPTVNVTYEKAPTLYVHCSKSIVS